MARGLWGRMRRTPNERTNCIEVSPPPSIPPPTSARSVRTSSDTASTPTPSPPGPLGDWTLDTATGAPMIPPPPTPDGAPTIAWSAGSPSPNIPLAFPRLKTSSLGRSFPLTRHVSIGPPFRGWSDVVMFRLQGGNFYSWVTAIRKDAVLSFGLPRYNGRSGGFRRLFSRLRRNFTVFGLDRFRGDG